MIRLDIAKAGAQLFSLNNVFNARVHDGFTPVKVQWINSTDGNQPLDVKGMKAFLKGRIGQGTIKDDHVELEPKSDLVSWEDDGSGSQPNGITLIKLPPQVFTRDGVFYGYIGLMDASGTVITSINIWFNVAKNNLVAGVNAPYYFSALNDALGRVNQAADSLQIFKRKVDDQVELARVTYQPETFETLDDLKKKYPNGAPGIYVVDADGHKYIWSHGAWKDCGIYQSAGLSQKVLAKLAPYQKGFMRRNLIEDPEFLNEDDDEWTDRGVGVTHTIDTSIYNGHRVMKIVCSTGKGGIYTTNKPVAAGDVISMSLIASFYSAEKSANASAVITFLKKADASINDADNTISSEGITSLNPYNENSYRRFDKSYIIVPAGATAMRLNIEFSGAATIYITEPLITYGKSAGPYELDDYQKQINQMSNRKNLISDPDLNNESNFWIPRNGMDVSRDKAKYNGHNVLHLSNRSSGTSGAFVVSEKMEITPGQSLAFFNEAYFTPITTGASVSVQIAFYTRDKAGQDDNFDFDIKEINITNAWHEFSINRIVTPANAAYVRVKYVFNGTGDLYIAVPMLVCNDHALLFDVDDLAKANPKSVIIDNPYYSTSRGYTWFHFDKITTDLYSDTQSLTWADYMNGTKGVVDDSYVENTWSPDGIGPAYSDHSKRLVYSIVTNRVTVTDKKSPYLLTLLAYDEEHGYYGILKDQYEAQLDNQRQGTFKHLDGLTDDMVDKLDKKTDELYPLIADNDKFVFGLMADNHQTGLEVNNYRPNYTGMAYERVRQALDPDANFNLGDSVLSTGDNLVALRRAFEYTPAKDWVYCEGNHDRWVHDPILPPTQFYAAVNRVHRNDSRFHFGDGSNGAYYYVDYDNKKLRVIVIDDYDVGPTHDAEYNDKAGIRQAQFDWLANTALQVDEGWYVLVMVHQSPYPDMPENNRVANSDQLVQLFNAFETGVNTTITAKDAVFEDGTFDINLTTNFQRPGKIIAVLSGHNHVDAAQVHNGVNYITSSCGYIDVLLYHSQNGQAPKYGQRDQHTYSAISFDFGVINFKEQTLRLKRFGYGQDRTFKW